MSSGEIKISPDDGQQALSHLQEQSDELKNAIDILTAANDVLRGSNPQGDSMKAAITTLESLIEATSEALNVSDVNHNQLQASIDALIEADNKSASAIGGGDGA
ncbi:MCP methyltransferase/methylesterase, CheR/CheB with PAS/PAC sensor [Coriobacterium glomerans PW2]|uniref:MCP methyltransferase/methylesterase, CheR/CheB with PAS/PAC sensor n=1 Tax=Coriobacterium glomerans (strain ATCC 49209 / DSM 20642 / JCM 10262 / PW2) TaxID=700015 RepID=F2N6U3_CORGP|nr:hypothetical protein [Coriobacterium glomerans]AEB06142.1 MCP methyltransferase/methylesterase, CheR/CheB with PAS/PAC sensor [Coriobacterium glomerans PW2]